MLGDNKKQVTAGISRAETQLLPELTAAARWLADRQRHEQQWIINAAF
jgi:hypothetical protein